MNAAALDVRLLELLSSRLCHDLVSPVGAINNGVELMEELGPDMMTEAMALIGESARKASRRLQCFRIAYGAGGGQGQFGLPDIRMMARDYFADGKVALRWEEGAAETVALPAGTGKVVLNVLLAAEETLAFGGTVAVAGTAQQLTVTAEGRSAGLSDAQNSALAGQGDVDSLTTREVQAYVTGMFARFYGVDLVATEVPGALTLRLIPPFSR